MEVASDRPAPGHGERILLVDDDADTRVELANAVRRAGFEVLVASSGEEAIRIARGLADAPALVVTDLVMHTMTGLHLVEELRKSAPALRAVFLADHLPPEQERVDPSHGPRRFLQKPVGLSELAAEIRQLLDADAVGESAEDAAGGEPVVHVMTGHTRTSEEMAARLSALGYGRVTEVPGVGARHDPPELLVVRPHQPAENMLLAVEPYLAQWSPETRPAVLIIASSLPRKVAARWPSLFPALLVAPDAPEQELDVAIRHLLEVRSLSDRYLRGQHGMAAQLAARSAELESQQHDLLLRLARVAELRDDLTGKHAERVGWLAGQLGAELGLPSETVELLVHAAPLHDLGKIATPDAILNKPDTLTHIERDLMRQHTVVGAQLLSGSKHRLLQEAEKIARSHHERWDGKGYPQGLQGEEIPIMARIVAVADAFDCITHTRSYREAFSVERAVQIIRQDAGSHFDPVVAAALTVLAERGALAPEWPKPPESKARRIA